MWAKNIMTRSKDSQPNYQMPPGGIPIELNRPPVRITRAQALAMPGESLWFKDGGGNYLTFAGVLDALQGRCVSSEPPRRDARGKGGKRRVMDVPASAPSPDTTKITAIEAVLNELRRLRPSS